MKKSSFSAYAEKETHRKMFAKGPKNSEKYFWTEHSKYKMRQYGLSPQRVTRVIRNPERTEVGIVENTVAVMQPASVKWKNFKKIWSQEIWAMFQINQKSKIKNQKEDLKNTIYKIPDTKYKIISAWRYPGVSPKNNPIPQEILDEINGII